MSKREPADIEARVFKLLDKFENSGSVRLDYEQRVAKMFLLDFEDACVLVDCWFEKRWKQAG